MAKLLSLAAAVLLIGAFLVPPASAAPVRAPKASDPGVKTRAEALGPRPAAPRIFPRAAKVRGGRRAARPRRRSSAVGRTASYYGNWYDGGRVMTSWTSSELAGFGFINVANPIVRTINGRSSQRVAFIVGAKNHTTGRWLWGDWWVGTTYDFGGFAGPYWNGGWVYNARTGERNPGDGGTGFMYLNPFHLFTVHMHVAWYDAYGRVSRQVGFQIGR